MMLPNKAISLFFYLTILYLNTLSLKASELKEIVILSSYHIGFQWSFDIDQTITKHFSKDESYRLFHEFMDSKRFSDSKYLESLRQTYSNKYQNHQISGLICVDNRAFEFYITEGHKLWGDIPVVFCGVNNIEEYSDILNHKKHAVVLENIDIPGTIELIIQLQPEIKEIVAISDQTLSGQIFAEQFKAGIKPFKKIKYQLLDATNPILLKKQLQELQPDNKAIYLLSLYTNRNGIANEMIKESNYFFNDIHIPIYSNWDFLMPDCIIGGKILTASDQGKHAARLLETMLKNENHSLYTFPKQNNIFDYVQLKKYNIEIPETIEQHILINTPYSFIKEHKEQLVSILAILIVLIFIIILLISDMIKRKKVELDLIKNEKRLELAVDGANEGLWDIEFNTSDIYINEKFAVLMGFEAIDQMQISINSWKKIVHPHDIDTINRAYLLHKTNKTEIFRCEVRMLKRNKEYSWFSIHGKITEKKNDIPLRVTGIIQNIDAQKKFEQDLKIAKEKAEESDRLKSSFLANMSHEIRTPMNAILGFTDLLLESQINEKEQKEYLSMVKKSGENLLTIINDIIDVSKIESGQLKIIPQKTDLHSMIKDLYAVGNSLIKTLNKSVELRLLINNIDVPFNIKTDELRLYQILLNLISNAIKFTEEGHIDVFYQYIDDKNLKISVRDTGPGIADADKLIVFDRFRQIDESTIKKHGGTGLGLSISRSLAELMHGTIQVSSPAAGGAMFSVTIPCLINESVIINI